MPFREDLHQLLGLRPAYEAVALKLEKLLTAGQSRRRTSGGKAATK